MIQAAVIKIDLKFPDIEAPDRPRKREMAVVMVDNHQTISEYLPEGN